ncbi:MAG: GW dipeptide domain-containing protein [Spirosomataceae bacterium]
MKPLHISILLISTVLLLACGSKPKVIVEDSVPSDSTTTTTGQANPNSKPAIAAPADAHQVTALEVLQAERYTYVKVKENNDTYWIATVKFDAKVGNTYLYRGGLLKTNFESQEHKRTFDKIYLVSEIIDAAAHPGGNMSQAPTAATDATPLNKPLTETVKDAIKLDVLLKNKEKYVGKLVVIYGKCIKANYGIMGKNWIHLQDGTKKDGKTCEITITTNENIPLGAIIALEGKVVLNKDFGAGYTYDILIEDAKYH